MHTGDLERVRKYRLAQAEQRGVLNAARSWFALRQDVYADTCAHFINDGETIAAECRDNTIRVWADLTPENTSNPYDTAQTISASRAAGTPRTTPEQNLVLEVVREVVPGGAFDYVLEGYVPDYWEIAFFSHVSSLCLEQRLEDRRRAIADEAREREAFLRQLRRWDV